MVKFGKCLIKFFFLLFLCININAQYTIEGNIYDSNNIPLGNANIIIHKIDSDIIIDYTLSNQNGFYSIQIEKSDSLQIDFSHLGFEKYSQILGELDDHSGVFQLNVNLNDESISLQEVVIEQKRPIRIKKDTISIVADIYTEGNERNIEDLLKKIPGINVDSKGTIKIGNQEIERLMVDGDDFFEKGYKVLSKNMPSYVIEEVEILKNYNHNSLLKGIQDSEEVAINLKLKEDLKRIWFGNLITAYGLASSNKYEVKGNLMNFGNQNKYYFLSSLNNIGEEATGDIKQLIQPIKGFKNQDIGDNQSIHSFTNLNILNIDFEGNRTNFNNDELFSLNSIFNPTKEIKIKTLLFFNQDERQQSKNEIEEVNVDGIQFINKEDYKLKNNKSNWYGNLELDYNPNDKTNLISLTKLNFDSLNENGNLNFNDLSNNEILTTSSYLLDQKLALTNKFNESSVLVTMSRLIRQGNKQSYGTDQSVYQELFEIENFNQLNQNLNNNYFFIGLNSKYISKTQKDNQLEIQIGNTLRSDNLHSEIRILDNNGSDVPQTDYANNLNYLINDLYFTTQYGLKFKKIDLAGQMELHKINSKTRNYIEGSYLENNAIFLMPQIEFGWRINSTNNLTSTFSYNNTLSKVENIYGNYILTGTRFFKSGESNFNQLSGLSAILNYQLGNWTDKIFVNSFFIFRRSNDYFSSNNFITQNYTLSETILLKDREFYNFDSSIDYYIAKISSNIKLVLEYTKSNFQNIVNDELRGILMEDYQIGLEIRSGFSGIFNYHLGHKLKENKIGTQNVINKSSNHHSFIDLIFNYKKTTSLLFKGERYGFDSSKGRNNFEFLDFELTHNLENSNWVIGLTGNNLLNTNTYKNIRISDIGYDSFSYLLQPRFFLIRVEYRF